MYPFYGEGRFLVYMSVHTRTHFIYKLVTIVKGDPKAPYSLATTLRCRRGHYSFPWIDQFTLDSYLIMLSVKQGFMRYQFFESLVKLNLGLYPGFLGHWMNTLPSRPMRAEDRYIFMQAWWYQNSAGVSWVCGHDASAPKPYQNPESSTDESFVGSSTVYASPVK